MKRKPQSNQPQSKRRKAQEGVRAGRFETQGARHRRETLEQARFKEAL